MVNYKGKECNGIEKNCFNFVVIWIVNDRKEMNEKLLFWYREEKKGNEFCLIYC